MQVAGPRKRRTYSRWALAALSGLLAVGGVLTNPAPALASPIGEPASITVTPGRRLIKVEWTAPVGGGATTYNVKASTGETCPATGGLTCTLSPVAANTPILVSVRACPANADDCSTWKAASTTVKAGPPATPPAPSVAYSSSDQTSMHLSWTENDEGAGISSYRVTASPAFTSQTGSCTTLVTGTSCDVAGLSAGSTYTFKLTAIGINNSTGSTGSSGVGPASTPKYVGAPAVPDAPTITQDSNDAVTVSWTKPSGGATISGYTVQKTTGGQSTDACTAAADATQCQVTGLSSTQSYTFKVKANGEGTYGGSSAYSSDSTALTPGKPNKPDAPTVELGASAGQVRVSWTPPDGGGSVTGYVVTPYSIDDQSPPAACQAAATARYCDFSGLDDGVAYTFKVVAKGAVDSDPSDASESITSQLPTKPSTPVAALVSGAPGSVRLTWTPQSTGGPVIFYTVTAIPGSGNQTGSDAAGCGFNLTTPSCTITGLDPAVSYTFKVTAVGDLGSVDSDASAAIVPDQPGSPTSATVTLDSSTGATVHWAAPSGGGAVESYTVTATPSDGTTAPAGCTAVSAGTTSCPFTGLDAAKSYSFKVTATNAAGHSDAAAAVAVPDIPGAPQSPAVALTTGTPGSVDVSWSAPASGTATRYVVTVASSDGGTPSSGCHVTTSPCTISGLSTDKHYTFTVRAENLLGGTDAAATDAVIPNKPGAPTTVAAGVTGSGTATVTWAAPATGGAVTSYTVTASSPDAGNLPGESPCPVDVASNPSATLACSFTGMDADKSYQFTVKATNAAGYTSADPTTAVIPGAPTQPGNVQAVLGNAPGKVTVHWDAPTGAPVTTTTVTATSGDGGTTRTCTATPGQQTCTFTNLTTSASYTFTVNAANAVDDVDSDPVPDTPIVPDEPGMPGNVGATRGNVPGKATVSWDAPTTGGAVATYTVTPVSTDSAAVIPTACTVLGTATRTCDFTTLTPSKPYTFTVSAINTAGHQNATSSPALVPNKPDKPANVTVTVPSPGSATVVWDAPTGAPVTDGWVVTPSSGDGGATPTPTTCTVASGGQRTCMFTGLSTTASYSFVVRASNEAGATDSDPTVPVVANKPNQPGVPAVQIVAPGTVWLNWFAPVGGGPVTSYNVDAYPIGNPDSAITRPAACTGVTMPTCQFDGLGEQTYTFRVTARGPGGDTQGDRSLPIDMSGPGKPAAPTVALTGPNAVTVSWDKPETGGPVFSFSVISTPDVSAPARCTNVQVMSCVFDRLTSGTDYTFKVVANGTADRSTASDDSATVTVPAVIDKPDAPGAPAATVLAADKVRLNWTAPTGGGPAGTYTAKAFTADAPDVAVTYGACTGVTALTCDFGGLSDTLTYTFRVTAIGTGGQTQGDRSAAVTTAGPGKPGTPAVELAGSRAVKVTWTAPTGIGPVTGYSVTSTPDASAPARCTNVLALSCVFDRLTSGTAYTFKVTAYGSAGRSVASDASASIIPGPPGTPAAPAVGLTDKTGQIQVTWTAPAIGGVVTGYQVQSSPGGVGCADPVGPNDTSCYVRPLDPATSYTFQVKALGAAGGTDSAFSPASVAITPGASAAPTDVDVAAGDRQLAVSWTAPSTAATGDSRVVRYRAVATPGGQYCETTTDTECTISGLTNLTSYTVTVTAVTADNIGTPSVPSARVRPTAGRPGSPTAVQAAVGDTTTVVSWTAPANAGNGISRYVATAVAATGAQRTCTTANGTTLTCTITGLSNGTPYSVTVVSVGRSASGYSDPSSAVTVTPKAAPGAPAGVTVTNAVKSLVVKWSAGTPSDGVTGYTATAGSGTSAPSCSTISATVLTCTITGLTPGIYPVSVVAKGTPLSSAPSTAVTGTALVAAAPTLAWTSATSSGTLTLSSATVRAGGTLTASGTGYAPYTTVSFGVYVGSTLTKVVATAVTDANGTFSQDITIPSTVTAGTSRTVVAGAQATSTAATLKYLTAPVTVTTAAS